MLKGKSGYWFLAFLALGLLIGPLSRAAERGDEEHVVASLQKSYDAIQDFVADFRQENDVKTLNRKIKASGKVYFKRPGKMLWRYEEPKGQWVLADGKNLYYYQPEQRQVIKSPLKKAFHSEVPVSFLLGIGNLRKDFNVTLKGSEQGNYVLQLAPKGSAGGFTDIQLGVDRRSFEIVWARILDATGNMTTIRFSGMQKGVGLKDSVFHLQLPDGADVVELPS
ncbi:MAG: outer membrane lipoprotein carrier protein LolA [Deltaproteobacteria bacterium]|nr:outer membrane lipoprotein carrier protein LolA [Deltaproteobacteria bacterium]